MAPTTLPTYDVTGSAYSRFAHAYSVGDRVIVTKAGVVQSWDVTIARLDRNSTYLLRFANGSFVSVHEEEVTLR